MAITAIGRDTLSQSQPGLVRIVSTDTLSAIGTSGYLTAQAANIAALNNGPFDWLADDGAWIKGSNGWGFYTISSDFTSLTAFAFGSTVVGAPVVVGDFAVFQSTSGNLEDLGYLPSNAAKTVVVMANAAVTANALAVFADTAGTLKDQSTAATLGFGLTLATGALSAPNLKYGATPVAQVDPGSCTISAAAGAANTATVTIQLKDGSATNLTRSLAFKVYASSAADGLTLASAASTGFSVASGGLSLNNGTAITTQISCMSSATGGCVLSLLDTGKQTSYLVLVLPNGNKISAQLSAGSYG